MNCELNEVKVGRTREVPDYSGEDNWAEAIEANAHTSVRKEVRWKCRRCGRADWVPVPNSHTLKANNTVNDTSVEYTRRKLRDVLANSKGLAGKLRRSKNVNERYCRVIQEQTVEIDQLRAQLERTSIQPEGPLLDKYLTPASWKAGGVPSLVVIDEQLEDSSVAQSASFMELLREVVPSGVGEKHYRGCINHIIAFIMNLTNCNTGDKVLMAIASELVRHSDKLLGSFSKLGLDVKRFLKNKTEPEGPFKPLLDFMKSKDSVFGDEKPPIIDFAINALASITFFVMVPTSTTVSEDYLSNWLRSFRNKHAPNVFECTYNAVYQFFDFLDTWHDNGFSLTFRSFTSCGTLATEITDLESKYAAFACRDKALLGCSFEYYVDHVAITVRKAREASQISLIKPAAKIRMEVLYDRARKLDARVTSNYALEIAREQPFAWGVQSVPRAGKSQICTLMQRAIGAVGSFPTDDCNTYQSNRSDDFDSGYTNQVTVYVKDDVGNSRLADGQEPEMGEMIRVVNNVPMLSVQAEVEKKGVISIRPKLVTVTSNFTNFAIPEATNCVASYALRFVLFMMRVKKEFARADGSLDNVKAVGVSPYDLHEFAVYTLVGKNGTRQYSIVTDTRFPQSLVENGVCKNWMSTLEAQRLLAMAAKRHYADQASYLKSSRLIVTAPCCGECGAMLGHNGVNCTPDSCEMVLATPEFELPSMEMVTGILNHSVYAWLSEFFELNESVLVYPFEWLAQKVVGLVLASRGCKLKLLVFLLVVQVYGFLHHSLRLLWACVAFPITFDFLLILYHALLTFLVYSFARGTFLWVRRLLKNAVAANFARCTAETVSSFMTIGSVSGLALAAMAGFRNFYFTTPQGNIQSTEAEDVIARAEETPCWGTLPRHSFVEPKVASAGEQTLNAIRSHTVYMHFRGEKAIGQLIGRTELLVNSHIFLKIKEEEELIFERITNPGHFVKVKWRGFAVSPHNEDMMIVILAKSFPVKDTIWKRVATNLDHLKYAKVLVQYPRLDEPCEYVWTSSLVTNNAFKKQTPSLGAKLKNGKSQNGDCGSLYVLKDNPGAIIGFHSGGSSGLFNKEAVAFGLTYNLLREVVDLAVSDVTRRETFTETVFRKESALTDSIVSMRNAETGEQRHVLEDVHARSFANFVPSEKPLACDVMTTYGHVDAMRGKPTSRVRTTPLSGALEELGYPRKHFKPSFRADRACSIAMHKAFKHTCGQIEPLLLARAQDDYLGHVRPYLEKIRPTIGVGPLTLHEALNGKKLERLSRCRFINQMPSDTSSGYEFVHNKDHYIEEYTSERGEKLFNPTPVLEESCRRIRERAQKGIRAMPLAIGSLKDEPTSHKKIVQGKYRIFTVFGFDFNLELKRLAAPIANELYSIPIEAGLLQGVNAMNEEWTQIRKGIVEFSPNIVCGDYSGWDITLSGQVIRSSAEVLCTLAQDMEYPPEEVHALWTLMCDLADGVMAFNGTVFSSDSWWSSGNWCTILVGGISNNLLLMSAWRELVGFEGPAFHRFNRLGTVGDDNLLATRNPEFSMRYLSDFFKKHNMVYTDADKKEVDRAFITQEEANICKRTWVLSDYIAEKYGKVFWQAPLELDSIMRPMHSMFKPKEECDIPHNLLGSLTNSLCELSRHSKEVFDTHRAAIQKAVEMSDLPYSLHETPKGDFSYEEWQEENFSKVNQSLLDDIVKPEFSPPPDEGVGDPEQDRFKERIMVVTYHQRDESHTWPVYIDRSFRGTSHLMSADSDSIRVYSDDVEGFCAWCTFLLVTDEIETMVHFSTGISETYNPTHDLRAELLYRARDEGVEMLLRVREYVTEHEPIVHTAQMGVFYMAEPVVLAAIVPECVFTEESVPLTRSINIVKEPSAMNNSARPAARMITPRKVLLWCFLVATLATSLVSLTRPRGCNFCVNNKETTTNTSAAAAAPQQETVHIEKKLMDSDAMTASRGINSRSVQSSLSNDGFFERPVKIQTLTWNIGETLDVRFNPWQLFCDDPRVINRLAHFALLRADMHVDFLITGNPFYRGRVMASYLPLPLYDDNTSFDATEKASFITASQRPHVMLDPTCSQGGELWLPFVYPKDYLSIPNRGWEEMGEILLGSLNNLQHENDAVDPIIITIQAHLKNVELCMPTSVVPGVIAPQNDEYGVISGPAHTVGKVANVLSNIPVIGTYARATEIASNFVGGVAKIFGFSRPRVLERRNIYYGPELAVADTSDNIPTLAMHAKKEVLISGECVWDDKLDSMAFQPIVKKKSFLTSFDWSPEDPPDHHLFSVSVRPLQSGTAGDKLHLTPSAWVCTPFQYWSGSITYTLEVVSSSFHKGKMRIVWDPVVYVGNDYNTAYSAIVDIDNAKKVSLTLGWAQDLPYLRVSQEGEVSFSSMQRYGPIRPTVPDSTANGIVSVFVLNSLTTPSQTRLPIEVNVWQQMSDDFQVCCLTEHLMRNFLPSFERKDPAGANEFLPPNLVLHDPRHLIRTTAENTANVPNSAASFAPRWYGAQDDRMCVGTGNSQFSVLMYGGQTGGNFQWTVAFTDSTATDISGPAILGVSYGGETYNIAVPNTSTNTLSLTMPVTLEPGANYIAVSMVYASLDATSNASTRLPIDSFTVPIPGQFTPQLLTGASLEAFSGAQLQPAATAGYGLGSVSSLDVTVTLPDIVDLAPGADLVLSSPRALSMNGKDYSGDTRLNEFSYFFSAPRGQDGLVLSAPVEDSEPNWFADVRTLYYLRDSDPFVPECLFCPTLGDDSLVYSEEESVDMYMSDCSEIVPEGSPFMNPNESEELSFHFGGNCPTEANPIHFGELYPSWRSIMKRYSTKFRINTNGGDLLDMILPQYPQADRDVQLNPATTPDATLTNYTHIVDWVSPAYIAMRGSTRVWITGHAASPTGHSAQDRRSSDVITFHRLPAHEVVLDNVGSPTFTGFADPGKMTLAGGHFEFTQNTGCAGVEIPYYNQLRFYPSRNTRGINQGFRDREWLRAMVQARDESDLFVSYAIGEDFNLNHFLCTPVVELAS